jgi:hypothetical protein
MLNSTREIERIRELDFLQAVKHLREFKSTRLFKIMRFKYRCRLSPLVFSAQNPHALQMAEFFIRWPTLNTTLRWQRSSSTFSAQLANTTYAV